MKRPHPILALLLWLTAAYAAGYVGTVGVLRGMAGPYPGLPKPSWTPPAWLFVPMGTVLSALGGLAAWRAWRAEPPRRGPLALWWLALGLGALWPWPFFLGRSGPALGVAAALWTATLATTVAFSRRDRAAPWLLVPALAWSGVLAVLSLATWRLGRA